MPEFHNLSKYEKFKKAVSSLNLKFENSEISQKTGHSKANVSKYLNGKLEPSENFYNDFQNSFNITIDSFKSDDVAVKSFTSGRPYYEGDWELGFKDSFDENLINPEYNIDFPPANKTNGYWMRGKGKSMLGEIDPGDFIYFSPMEDFSWFPFGRIYGIVTKNKMRTVKRIVKSEKPGHYLLVSSNPDKMSYPDQDIPIEMIVEMCEVKFVIKNLNE